MGSVSLGTSGVLFAPLDTPTPDPQGRVHLFAHADGGYHPLGVTLACAGALQWFRDALAPKPAFAALLAMPAAGLFPDLKAVMDTLRPEGETVAPQPMARALEQHAAALKGMSIMQ